MKKNVLTIATIALIVCGLGIYFLNNRPSHVDENFISFIESEGLTQIKIVSGDKTIDLSNDEQLSQWTVATKDRPQVIADASRIVRFLDNLNDVKVLQEVTKKEEHYERFELSADKATQVVVKRTSKDDLTLYLGKSKDYSSQFVRKDNDPQVYLVSHKFNIDTDFDRWIHKKLKIEKDDLKAIKYQTKEKKKVDLAYDSSKNNFTLNGKLPKKKKLRNLSSLASQFTEINLKGIEEAKNAPKGKAVSKHSVTLKDDTKIDYKFIEAKESKDTKRYFLELDIKAKNDSPSPKIGYLATLSKEHLFELHSIPTHTFQKKWDEFFEEVKEPKKTDAKTKAKENKKGS